MPSERKCNKKLSAWLNEDYFNERYLNGLKAAEKNAQINTPNVDFSEIKKLSEELEKGRIKRKELITKVAEKDKLASEILMRKVIGHQTFEKIGEETYCSADTAKRYYNKGLMIMSEFFDIETSCNFTDNNK